MTRKAASGMAAGEASVPSATLGAGGDYKPRNNESDYGQTSHEDMVRLFVVAQSVVKSALPLD
jgi:hypothetical protein